tara:strand:+ start:2566 stop:3084 length:519 start_codon:yes stop_codon:yes gene_type:complete
MINNFFFLIVTLFFPFHDFHVTHTTFHYNDESKSMEITIKVAIEDLEKSIKNKSTKKLDELSNYQENINSEKLILEYFRNNLTFLLTENTKEFKWVGKETSNNLHDIYLYFEIANFDKNENIESITIKNTLFLDLYDYQTNIVLIELPDRKYNLTFTKDKDIQTIFMNKSSK